MWPAVGKTQQNWSKLSKSRHRSLHFTKWRYLKYPEVFKTLVNYFSKKICWQNVLKIARNGHAGGNANCFTSFYFSPRIKGVFMGAQSTK